jgi:hypothetical protein
MQRLAPKMERQVSETVDPGIAALIDICDMLAQFHRELQQLRAQRRQGSETHSEPAEERDNSRANATREDNGENGTGASPP